MKLLLLSILGLMTAQFSQASLVAIVDSGVDTNHREIQSYIWRNPVDANEDGEDQDRNGYMDDFLGWNFAENNNQVIDARFLGSFSPDVYRFYDIQNKLLSGSISPDEIRWARMMLMNMEFRKSIGTFGNFVHGTHVAGIASRDLQLGKVMAVKLIPTEVAEPTEEEAMRARENLKAELQAQTANMEEVEKLQFLKELLATIGKKQVELLQKVAEYIDGQGADVANGSFGTGFTQALGLVIPFYEGIFNRMPEKSEMESLAKYFMQIVLEEGKKVTMSSPKTLFVFAAGNDGLNNDINPTTPANIRTSNVISVAATFGRSKLADFSNFGVDTVDVAAPGVMISSTIPGDRLLSISGTSQATPFVANLAGKIRDTNPRLTPAEVKFIIMSTVDKKSFLRGKVRSEGIINEDRAHKAAKYSLHYPVSKAVVMAQSEVNDVMSRMGIEDKAFSPQEAQLLEFALPLPSPLSLSAAINHIQR